MRCFARPLTLAVSQHYSDTFLQTHFGFFVSFVNDVEPKVAQRPTHQFSDSEAMEGSCGGSECQHFLR
jgi:hypothetical protein